MENDHQLTGLDSQSRCWVFGSDRELIEPLREEVLGEVRELVGKWTAHGKRLNGACEVLHDRFLVVGLEESSPASGCSIDKMFGTIRSLEKKHGLTLLDSGTIFYAGAEGKVIRASRAEFKASVARGEVDAGTVVFDTSTEALQEVLSGRWKKPAGESWHAEVFGLRSPVAAG